MLDMMSPLISESEHVSQDLLDIILLHIIEPLKVGHSYPVCTTSYLNVNVPY